MADAAATMAAAFLDEEHHRSAANVAHWVREHLLEREEPLTDAAARTEARALLRELGSAGWLSAIGRQDLRSLSLLRDAVAGASPLADAVVALQGLGGTPIVLAGSDEQRSRWLPSILDGRTMTAFAMTEPEAGTDVAAMQTTARRDTDAWIIDGEKHLISNAGLADLYVVFAVTSPGQGSRGISCFLVPKRWPHHIRWDGCASKVVVWPRMVCLGISIADSDSA
jgi:acyl-CoA dehydrogenase